MQHLTAKAEVAPEIERRKLVAEDNAFAARLHDAINDGNECEVSFTPPPSPGIILLREEAGPAIDNGPGRPVVLKPDRADEMLLADIAADATSDLVIAAETARLAHEGRSRRFGRYHFLDLGTNQCRWPSDDEQNFTFCGAPVSHGSYCMKHTRLAYRGRGRVIVAGVAE